VDQRHGDEPRGTVQLIAAAHLVAYGMVFVTKFVLFDRLKPAARLAPGMNRETGHLP
jgi:hypothetical protein